MNSWRVGFTTSEPAARVGHKQNACVDKRCRIHEGAARQPAARSEAVPPRYCSPLLAPGVPCFPAWSRGTSAPSPSPRTRDEVYAMPMIADTLTDAERARLGVI